MRKYFIASVVAMVAFAMAAFAASLTVNAGTLEAGVDSDLTCFDTATVTYATGYNQTSSSAGYSSQEPFDVRTIHVALSGGDEDCINDNLRGHLKLNDGDANPIGPHGYAISEIEETDDGHGFSVDLGTPMLVEHLNQVQVMVKEFENSGEEAGYLSGVFEAA